MTKWKTEKLGKLVKFSSGGTPNKKIAAYWGGDIPWISAKTMKSDRIDTSDLFITEEGLSHGSKLAPEGSLLLLVRGSGLFNGIPICYVSKPVAYNQDVKCIDSISEIENKYIYYWLKANSAYLQKKLEVTGIGAGKFDTKFLSNLDISYPDKETRRKIIEFADDITDRLALTESENNNLSKQIRTLSSAWFYDFSYFGGQEPIGWVKTKLSDIAEFVTGYSYKSNELRPSTTAMATIKNFDRKGGFKLDGFKEIIPSSKLKKEQHAVLFDTLVAHTDLTQNADVIGNAEPVLSVSEYEDIVFSMDLVKVVPLFYDISKFTLAALLQAPQFKSHCLGYVNGTTVLHLSKKALPEFTVAFPRDHKELKIFDEIVTEMYIKMAFNIEEDSYLFELRDTLLPRLMSGELDVTDANI